MFAKVSIALQLVRVASQKRVYLIGLWIIIGTIVLSLSFTTIYLLSQCTPIKYALHQSAPKFHRPGLTLLKGQLDSNDTWRKVPTFSWCHDCQLHPIRCQYCH